MTGSARWASASFVRIYLVPETDGYPDVKVEFSRDNGLRNIIEDGFDAGVQLGETVEKDMVAVRIGPDWRLVAIGSPAYFTEHGVPKAPQDLVGHNCICLRLTSGGGLYAWEFQKDDRDVRMRVDGRLVFNSTLLMVDAAVAGLRDACRSSWTTGRRSSRGTISTIRGAERSVL